VRTHEARDVLAKATLVKTVSRIMGLVRQRFIVFILLCLLGLPSPASAAEETVELLTEAQSFLHEGVYYMALDRLREAARLAPHDYRVHKVSGDVLMSFRRNWEALDAYRQAAAIAPDALEVHWALWALLDRMGIFTQAIQSLKEIVRLDSQNPLAYLRLARSLSQADRLEEAVESYRHAVELDPGNLPIRLLLARALYDVLDYQGARQQLDVVMGQAEADSPERASAQDLLILLRGESYDKGRRYDQVQTLRKLPWHSDQNLKKWVLARGEGWRLMEQGHYDKAEAAFRKALSFNPEDHRAMYDLGLVLMKLGRYEEAINSFESGIRLTKFAEFYPDSVFQIGRCLAKLGRWEEAIVRFERVLQIENWRHEDFYALNFPDLAKVKEALDEARAQLPRIEAEESHSIAQHGERFGPEPYEYPIPPLANGYKMIDPIPTAPQRALLGTESVRGAFRQVVTARDVVQDDLQTGLLEFMAINPTDTFRQQDPEVYLVFTLTSNQEDLEVKLTSRWVAERTTELPSNTLVGTDTVILGLNERSGYFRLPRPEGGWRPGIYRIDLYLGPQVSAYTYMADLRFRIVAESHPLQTNP
jgi:tetratricopeptide (TPR) repeat protein